MLRLISGPLSLFAKKVEIALAEKAIAHERVMAAFTQTSGYAPRHPEVLAHNPKRQVPVLVDGDLALYDSTLIIEYLEDAFPAPPLFPAEPRDRARCRQWELFADEVMLEAVRRYMHRTEPGAKARDDWRLREEAARAADATLTQHFAALDQALAAGDFLVGAFSAADIAVFMQVFYAQRLGGPPVAPHPNLARWRVTLAARPSIATMIEETRAADAALSAPVEGAFRDE